MATNPPHLFLSNPTERVMYNMALQDPNEDSARALWVMVMAKVFQTRDGYINTPEFYITNNNIRVRIDYCTRKLVSIQNTQTLLLPCVALEGKPEKQTESQDTKADNQILKACTTALTMIPQQRMIFAIRWLGTKVMFYVVQRNSTELTPWSQDYMDIDVDAAAISGYFNQIKARNLL